VSSPWCANRFAAEQAGETIAQALDTTDLIIDASASVVAARHLSDHPAPARRSSVFFNPVGEASVLLMEPSGRGLTLRDLEAQYLGLVLRTPRLDEHLGRAAETIAYTGAGKCPYRANASGQSGQVVGRFGATGRCHVQLRGPGSTRWAGLRLDGGKSEVLRSFDPTAEETLFIPRLIGG
jgi:hypothetical protein